MTTAVVDHLKSLHTGAVDARHGYEEARHDAEPHGLIPLFQKMIDIHTRNASELAGALAEVGEQADEEGSFMSTIHRTIMSVRSLFGGLGKSVLPGLIDGEERNVSAFNEALDIPGIDARLSQVLTVQRDRLSAAIVEMRAIEQT